MAKMSTDELLDVFKEMTLIELSEFVKAFEDTFEVTAAAPVAVAAAAPAAGGGGGVSTGLGLPGAALPAPFPRGDLLTGTTSPRSPHQSSSPITESPNP